MFELGLDALTLAFCAGVSPEQRALVKEILSKNEYALSFSIEYLNRKGLHAEAEELKAYIDMRKAA